MNKLPTYTEQFNKITEAYIKGEIELNNSSFCFCGTLSNGLKWKEGTHHYTTKEYIRMEVALFSKISNADFSSFNKDESYYIVAFDITEDEVFNGMVAALEVLKQIHIEHGEVIDDEPVFTKRILQT